MARRSIALPLFSLLFLTDLSSASADVGGIALESSSADHVDYDMATGKGTFKGHAHLTYKDAYLAADQIIYDSKAQIATAQGHVELTRGSQRVVADEIVYRLSDRTFSVKNMRLGDTPLYVSGDQVSGSPAQVIVSNATATYHEPVLLGPTLKAKTLTYTSGPDARLSAEYARIGVGPIKPFALLKFDQKLHEPFISYLDAKTGYSGALGGMLDLGVKIPVYPGVKLGGNAALYTKRGVLVGPAASYDTQAGTQHLTGSLKTGYIHDYGSTLTDILDQPIAEDRGFIEWKHHQQVDAQTTLFGQVSYWSDSEIIRDFRANEFYPVQQPDTFFEADRTGANYVVSLFTRLQPNRYYRVQQRLPEVRFDLLPIDVGHGIYERFNSSFAVLREDALLTGATTESTRLDAYYGLARPTALNAHLTVTPVVGTRLTHYAQATHGRDQETRLLGEVGFDSSLRASGTFAYKNERWGIDGIRHLITPTLSYRYLSANRAEHHANIPAIDDTTFMTYLRPLGLGDERATDSLHAANTFRLGLDNTFQTRDKQYGSRDLLRVNLAADYLPDPDAGTHDLSDLHTALALTPIHWLEFNFYQRFSPQDFALQELNTGLTLRDGEAWTLRLYNHYLKSQINEYIAEGTYHLNESYQLYSRVHLDSRRQRFVEQTYGLEQNISGLWTIRYGVSVYQGNRREHDLGFHVEVRLLGF